MSEIDYDAIAEELLPCASGCVGGGAHSYLLNGICCPGVWQNKVAQRMRELASEKDAEIAVRDTAIEQLTISYDERVKEIADLQYLLKLYRNFGPPSRTEDKS